MEIEMMKSQLKECQWIKEENNNESSYDEKKCLIKVGRVRKRRKKRINFLTPYCRMCRRYFKSISVLSIHKRVCPAKSISKQISEKIVESISEETDVKVDINERFEYRPLISCKDCKLLFPSTKEIFEHRQFLECATSSENEETDLSENTDDEYEYDTLYTCNICRAKFISSRLLKIHRTKERHWSLKSKKATTGIQFSEDYEELAKDDAADFTFRSRGENQYSCVSCNSNSIYYDPDDLLKHHRAVHSSHEHYCRYCSYKLSGIAEFNEHHYVYHELQTFCRVCNDKDKQYSKAKGLPPKPFCLSCSIEYRVPFDNCLSVLKENLYCDDCERVMPSIAHIRYHNCQKEDYRICSISMLVCPLCLESYNSLRSLYRHIIRHNDILSFCCTVCGRLHETWKALKAHLIKTHASVDVRLPKISDQTLRLRAEDVLRRFVKNGVPLLI